MTRRLLLVPLLLLVATAERCPDALQKIAEALHDAAVVTGEVQTMAISASDNDVITKQESDDFIEAVTVPLLSAIGHGNSIVKDLLSKEEKERDEILEILPPVIEAVKAALADENIDAISNEGTKASIRFALQGVSSALLTLQAVTEVNTL